MRKLILISLIVLNTIPTVNAQRVNARALNTVAMIQKTPLNDSSGKFWSDWSKLQQADDIFIFSPGKISLFSDGKLFKFNIIETKPTEKDDEDNEIITWITIGPGNIICEISMMLLHSKNKSTVIHLESSRYIIRYLLSD